MFIDSILEHGVPARVWKDTGDENRDISILMILLQGLNCASFMWGPSVFNTWIEWLWLEVGKWFVCQWHAFFFWLERCHLLKQQDGCITFSPYSTFTPPYFHLRLLNSLLQRTHGYTRSHYLDSFPYLWLIISIIIYDSYSTYINQ